jgi:ankyrin repeat protein
VKILLRAGADRSIRDHQGKTALELAVAAGHRAVVELLRPGAGGAAGGDAGLGTGPASVD